MSSATLYNNKSDKCVIEKSLQQLSTLSNVHYKDITEIVNPTIYVHSWNTNCNYIYLSQFDRYYYVNNVRYANQRYEIDMHVDVLMSFKGSILKQKVLIERAEHGYNLYLNDTELPLENVDTFETHPFQTDGTDGFIGSGGCYYLLAMVGKSNSTPTTNNNT